MMFSSSPGFPCSGFARIMFALCAGVSFLHRSRIQVTYGHQGVYVWPPLLLLVLLVKSGLGHGLGQDAVAQHGGRHWGGDERRMGLGADAARVELYSEFQDCKRPRARETTTP